MDTEFDNCVLKKLYERNYDQQIRNRQYQSLIHDLKLLKNSNEGDLPHQRRNPNR